MTVEAATYVSQFDVTLPADPDPLGEGNQHIRLIKAALKATFPNITAPVLVTQDDLATVQGTQARVAALEGSVLVKSATSQTVTGSLTVTGPLFASTLCQSVAGGSFPLVPRGIISMWSGAITTIPPGWLLCDGTLGTPDLRDRFILGAGGTNLPYQSGGQAEVHGLNTFSDGIHDHTGSTSVAAGVPLSGSVDPAGSHAHGGADQPHALTVDEMPSHHHQVVMATTGGTYGGGSYSTQNSGVSTSDGSVDYTGFTGAGAGHAHAITADGQHTHAVTINSVPAHGHAIYGDGYHSHLMPAIPMIPPYLALAFIMKS